MNKVFATDNASGTTVGIKVETDYDNGPYVSLVVMDSSDNVLVDLSIPSAPSVGALMVGVIEAAEKFENLLDSVSG